MKVIAVIPVKRLNGAKQRLAGRLWPAERAGIVLRCLRGELDILGRSSRIADTIVVTPDPQARALAEMHGATVVLQVDSGLNAAARLGRERAAELGARHALILHGDLPFLTAADVDAFLDAAGRAGAAIAPDRRDGGTNGLLLPLDACVEIAYGLGSYARHVANARAAGLEIETVRSPGLGFDLDTPADLLEYRRRLRRAADGRAGLDTR